MPDLPDVPPAEPPAGNAEHYRTVLASMDEGFCVLQLLFDDEGRPVDYRYLETNPVFEEQTGLTGALGRTNREMIPDIEPFWHETYGRVALTGEPVRFQSRASALGRWFDVNAFRIGRPADRQVAVLFSDVTARKEAEQERERLLAELEVERARLAEVIRRAPAFMAVLRGGEHTIEIVNDAYQQLIGHRDVVGRPLFEALPDVAGQGFEELLERVLDTGEPFVGHAIPVRIQRTPAPPPSGGGSTSPTSPSPRPTAPGAASSCWGPT